jgi:hypothetical protein
MVTIQVDTIYGYAEFTGDDATAAHKQLKRRLRQIGLSIKKLRFVHEICGEILYAYGPENFGYDDDKAQKLYDC